MKVCAVSFVFSVVTVGYLNHIVHCQTQAKEPTNIPNIRGGRYIPELYGIKGKYKIDLRGKYKHIPVPYDGGYGDSGEKYLHDAQEAIAYYHNDGSNPQYYNTADLGVTGVDFNPEADYVRELRFAVEVNYDRKRDCRIIELTWDELGKEKYHYVYRTQNPIVREEEDEEKENVKEEPELEEQATESY